MTLYELGQEYLNQHRAVRERIRTVRNGMKGLTPKQRYLCRCRILSLDEVATSLKITGEYLISYYGGCHE